MAYQKRYDNLFNDINDNFIDGRGFDTCGFHEKTGTKFNTKGYNKEGYDKDGYNIRGFNKEGIHKITQNEFDEEDYDKNGYNREGYNREGYDREGYDKEGYNKKGYDREGYDKEGYDIREFNREGIHKITRNKYNLFGTDKYGCKEDGYSIEGYDKNGYNREGYDKRFFNKEGINKRSGEKYNADGYDKEGYNKEGYDKFGYDKEGYKRSGFNKEGIHKITQNEFDEKGYDKDGYNREGYNREGYDKRFFNKEGINKRTRTKYNKEGYDKEGFNEDGYNRFGYDKEGYNKDGYDWRGYIKSYEEKIYDEDGYSKFGINKEGIDKSTGKKSILVIAVETYIESNQSVGLFCRKNNIDREQFEKLLDKLPQMYDGITDEEIKQKKLRSSEVYMKKREAVFKKIISGEESFEEYLEKDVKSINYDNLLNEADRYGKRKELDQILISKMGQGIIKYSQYIDLFTAPDNRSEFQKKIDAHVSDILKTTRYEPDFRKEISKLYKEKERIEKFKKPLKESELVGSRRSFDFGKTFVTITQEQVENAKQYVKSQGEFVCSMTVGAALNKILKNEIDISEINVKKDDKPVSEKTDLQQRIEEKNALIKEVSEISPELYEDFSSIFKQGRINNDREEIS